MPDTFQHQGRSYSRSPMFICNRARLPPSESDLYTNHGVGDSNRGFPCHGTQEFLAGAVPRSSRAICLHRRSIFWAHDMTALSTPCPVYPSRRTLSALLQDTGTAARGFGPAILWACLTMCFIVTVSYEALEGCVDSAHVRTVARPLQESPNSVPQSHTNHRPLFSIFHSSVPSAA